MQLPVGHDRGPELLRVRRRARHRGRARGVPTHGRALAAPDAGTATRNISALRQTHARAHDLEADARRDRRAVVQRLRAVHASAGPRVLRFLGQRVPCVLLRLVLPDLRAAGRLRLRLRLLRELPADPGPRGAPAGRRVQRGVRGDRLGRLRDEGLHPALRVPCRGRVRLRVPRAPADPLPPVRHGVGPAHRRAAPPGRRGRVQCVYGPGLRERGPPGALGTGAAGDAGRGGPVGGREPPVRVRVGRAAEAHHPGDRHFEGGGAGPHDHARARAPAHSSVRRPRVLLRGVGRVRRVSSECGRARDGLRGVQRRPGLLQGVRIQPGPAVGRPLPVLRLVLDVRIHLRARATRGGGRRRPVVFHAGQGDGGLDKSAVAPEPRGEDRTAPRGHRGLRGPAHRGLQNAADRRPVR